MRLGSYYRRLVLQYLQVHPAPGFALDVGCYDGSVLAGMPIVQLVGLDRDPAPVMQCAVPVVRADGRRPPFRPGSFATVFALDVLEHEQDDRSLAEALLDLVAPGGILWLSVPHRGYRAVPAALTGLLHRRWGHVRPGYATEDLVMLFGPGMTVEILEWNEPVFRLVYLPARLLWRLWPAFARLLLRRAAWLDARWRGGQSGHLFARVVRRAAASDSSAAAATLVSEPSPPLLWSGGATHAPKVLKLNDGYVMWYDHA